MLQTFCQILQMASICLDSGQPVSNTSRIYCRCPSTMLSPLLRWANWAAELVSRSFGPKAAAKHKFMFGAVFKTVVP